MEQVLHLRHRLRPGYDVSFALRVHTRSPHAHEHVHLHLHMSSTFSPPPRSLLQNMTHPSNECSDCSYNLENMYDQIDLLRYTLWEAYFVGAMGKTGCSEILCNFRDPSLLSATEPMIEHCRRCHYPIEDFINTDHEACLHGDLLRCVSLTRGINNYMQDVFAPDLEDGKAGKASNATNDDSTEDGSDVVARIR